MFGRRRPILTDRSVTGEKGGKEGEFPRRLRAARTPVGSGDYGPRRPAMAKASSLGACGFAWRLCRDKSPSQGVWRARGETGRRRQGGGLGIAEGMAVCDHGDTVLGLPTNGGRGDVPGARGE